jgi:hypothetical protein
VPPAKRAGLAAEQRLALRRLGSRPILDKEIEAEVLPKIPQARSVLYPLKNWTALRRYFDEGECQKSATSSYCGTIGCLLSRDPIPFLVLHTAGVPSRSCGDSRY